MKEHDTSKFHLEGKPPLKEALPLGLQHFVSMIAGNMVPAMLISNIVGLDKQMSTMLMQGAMLVAGIATLLQLYSIPLFKGHRLGSKLPVIMGTNYVFLGACLSVAGKYGLKALFGAQIGGAIVVFL
ncbi:solute carrier family 23 protein [Clostridioides sp. ZZV14-5902]|uniref:solute carrier family 23 protein n=1 Tax=Clostridioides sp. ZZV14-5902 TaxID=2811486 RepID=UPI0020D26AC3